MHFIFSFFCVYQCIISIESSYTYIFYYSVLFVVKCIVMYNIAQKLCVCVFVCVLEVCDYLDK